MPIQSNITDAVTERRSGVVRYGYAVLAVAVALGAALALRSFDLEGFLFVIAVPVAVWLGGRGPGVLAIVLSVLVLHFVFIAPADTGAVLPSYAYFVVFSVLAVLITGLSEARHRAEHSLLQARDLLEATVRERTAELQRSNQQLRAEVAERKRAEEGLRRSEELLVEGQRLSHTGSWRWQASNGVLRWSEEHYRLLGYDPGTPEPSLDTVWERVHPDDRQRAIQLFDRAIRDQVDYLLEVRVILPDGSIRHIDCVGHPVVDGAGELVELVGTSADLTERKAAEEALRLSEAALAHVTRVTTLGEVTASFAHEVNQPLAAIANNANACLALLPGGRPDLDEVRAALTDITSDAERASTIIERVRALATRAPSEKAPVRLEDVVGDIVALAATEAAARRVTIRVEVATDLPVVSGDRVQLQQVLLNLLVNGMDAMAGVPEVSRVLEIRGRPAMQDGSLAAAISVQDHGTGLDAAESKRLFEAFYTTKPHGMGMGLAISRSIIEMHGGRLWAEPNRGPGATFSFSVPAIEAAS